jgi:Leucine-rich repeat (LRR) protein
MFASLGSLETLLLNNNQVKAIKKDSFKELSLINRLDLSGNQFENLNDEILESLPPKCSLLIHKNYLN